MLPRLVHQKAVAALADAHIVDGGWPDAEKRMSIETHCRGESSGMRCDDADDPGVVALENSLDMGDADVYRGRGA